MRRLLALLLPLLGLLAVPPQFTEAQTEDASRLTLERIYDSSEFNARSFSGRWLPVKPGEPPAYLTLESSAGQQGGRDLVRHDAASGETQVFVPARDLVPPGRSRPLSIDGYQWSRDLSRVLIFTNSRRVWRRNTRGDYWVLHRATGQLTQIGGGAPPASLMYAKFSPDGNAVAYVHEGNLYVQDLIGGSIEQLTERANDRILNAMTDWVYEEEFGLRDAFEWSPDGQRIAYLRFDTSGVGDFNLINNTDSLYPTLKTFAYPKAGTRNSKVEVAIADLGSDQTQLLDLPGDPRETYVPRIQWIEPSGDLLVRQMNRLQNRETLRAVDPETLEQRVLLTETDAAWIDLQPSIHFINEGRAFLYLSDRDGWRHLYRVSTEDGQAQLLTPGGFDVIDLVSTVPRGGGQAGRVYFIASPDAASERFLYACSWKDGGISRVTPEDARGVHGYQIAPSGAYAIHRSSTTEQPPRIELVALPAHETVRVLESNEALAETMAKLNTAPFEFFQVDIGDTKLDAWQLNPPEMKPGQKYPLLVYVYGEPAGSTVVNRWGGSTGLWHRMLAQRGCVVVSIDNRGTKAPRGRQFRKSVYRRLGTLGPDDQAAAVRALLSRRDDLDADRVGAWGWSGGGTSTLHALFRYPELYQAGVSIAPVANLSYYDTIYEERYMGLPTSNVTGYRLGSAIHFADQLQGDLLLVHGTADDNVHYQATEMLIDRLVAAGKQFEMFAYPGRTHSISEGPGTREHLMTMVTEFLTRTLAITP